MCPCLTKSLLFQSQCQRNSLQDDFYFEQEYCSFHRRHLVAYGIQNGDSDRQSYTPYTLYDFYISMYHNYYTYYTYINYTYYCQVRQDLGIADHVWQDKRAAIAKTVDDLGDQFRLAMRTGWLAYIRTAYPDDAAPAAGPPVGQGTLVVPD
jgi:hypothetical protein